MESVVLALVAVCLLGLLGFAWMRKARRKTDGATTLKNANVQADYKVSYAPPEFEWSGTTSGNLPIKTLTYKQYECLEDARYGFRIFAVAPSERKEPQPHKTRAHGLKTVASLKKHGFLAPDGLPADIADGGLGYVITDHGLNALEVCSVRY